LRECGTNLPPNLGPWRREEMPGVVVVTEDDAAIYEAVERDGFCVVDDRLTC
jgi:hypothetical protein